MPYKLYQVNYKDERMIPDIYRLVSKDLSEPYSIFTYRYFLHNFPHLCICYYAVEDPNATGNEDIEESEIIPEGSTMVATIVSSISEGKTGYIAMLAVDQTFRNRGLGSKLVKANIDRIIADGCNEIILETEVRLILLLLLLFFFIQIINFFFYFSLLFSFILYSFSFFSFSLFLLSFPLSFFSNLLSLFPSHFFSILFLLYYRLQILVLFLFTKRLDLFVKIR